jgi:hypothetical protein
LTFFARECHSARNHFLQDESRHLKIKNALLRKNVQGGISMLVVRNSFVAKPGQATKLAAQIKDAASTGKFPKFRVLTDLTGDFNRVVLEFEVENIAEFEKQLKDYGTNEAFRAKMKGYTDLWISGSREIMQIT